MIKKNPSWFIQFYIFIFIGILSFSCTETKDEISNKDKPSASINIWKAGPSFNEDSAYVFIDKQVSFGPRIPNTKKHIDCGDWIVNKLNSYNLEVYEQLGEVTAFNSSKLPLRNISAVYNTNASKKVMLCAHWDTRPFADRDSLNTTKPILGANDGASGVGVLLEIARIIAMDSLDLCVEFIFFDVEDYGAPQQNGSFFDLQSMNDTWCLGSQFWSYNLKSDYKRPKFGILLDMVGAENAVFPKEEISRRFAGYHLNKVWKLAEHLGYGNYFKKKIAPPITDDHTYINQITKIPVLDIIHYDVRPFSGRFDFGSFHHTHADNMDVIHKPTLKAVGQTVLDYLYNQ